MREYLMHMSAAIALVSLTGSAHGTEWMTASFYHARGPGIAAHRTLPFGTRLQLFNPRTKRSARVIIHDRGPYVRGRSLDVSRHTAAQLGFVRQGKAPLIVRRVR